MHKLSLEIIVIKEMSDHVYESAIWFTVVYRALR